VPSKESAKASSAGSAEARAFVIISAEGVGLAYFDKKFDKMINSKVIQFTE
jgi:hypothetical protein